MFDGVVLGVDPGTASMGLALVRGERGRPAVAWASTLRSASGSSVGARLQRIYGSVRAAIERDRPDVLALERVMWGRNHTSALEVARASGAVIVAAAEAGVAVEEYAPLEVKMAITGIGNAGKEQVRRALANVFLARDVPDDPDAADAVAVAVCHVQQSRMRGLTRRHAP